MKATLQKWGNSQGIRIPKDLLNTLGIEVGTELSIGLSDDKTSITLSPAKDCRPIRGRHRIEELIANSSPDAYAGEVDWGEPQGNEAW